MQTLCIPAQHIFEQSGDDQKATGKALAADFPGYTKMDSITTKYGQTGSGDADGVDETEELAAMETDKVIYSLSYFPPPLYSSFR